MTQVESENSEATVPLEETRWITATVALFAAVVFVYSGSHVLPGALGLGAPASPELITAFLLNIALLLFAWRRSSQLKQSFTRLDTAESRLREMAYFDEVTGLHNRRFLREAVEARAASGKSDMALLLIDIDHFKKINDLYGHELGDELLQLIAGRIRNVCDSGALCVRLGGDEFAVLLVGRAARAHHPAELAAHLVEELAQPAVLSHTHAAVSASIGVSQHVEAGQELSSLLKSADIAMYEAKRQGRDRWIAFDHAMEEELVRRNALEVEVRAALKADQFVPYFQPVIDLATSEVRGFEVLARWRHPTRGLVEPREFLSVAEAGGLIAELSLTVMEKALTVAANWPHRYKIAVNVSPVQFKDPLLPQRILRILSHTGFPPGRLELEIMETTLLQDHESALRAIKSLKNSGIGITVDDLGSGYALFTKLESLPFDRIKIDRRFVETLNRDRASDALVRAIGTLGKGLCIPISAEGVETKTIQSKLMELGCEDAQGWLYSKAISAEEAALGFGALVADEDYAEVKEAVR